MNAEIQRTYREKQIAKRRQTNAVNGARFRAAHPDQAAAIRERARLNSKANRAASRSNADPALVAEADALRAFWTQEDGWLCGYCGKPAEGKQRTADHVTPISKGGLHVPANLKRACRACNSRKNSRTVYFA